MEVSTFETPAVAGMGHMAPLVVLAIVLIVAVYMELKESRIPNWLTLPGMGIGLMLGYLPGGLSLQSSLGGLGIGFGFLFMFYVFGGIGGGDVKLMGAVGALLGHALAVPALFYTAILGGFMALMVLIWRKSFWSGLKAGAMMFIRGRKATEENKEKESLGTIPYGLAIAGGCLAALMAGSV